MPPLDMWDYLTFLAFFVVGAGFVGFVLFILGLPGRIAYAAPRSLTPAAVHSPLCDESIFGPVHG